MKSKLPKIAIVGRANVGKSTLFNRIVEQRKALTSPIAGTTRDRNIATAEWRGVEMELIDTGGLDVDSGLPEVIAQGIVRQANTAIIQADLIFFVVDSISGATASDKKLANELLKRNLKSKTILVANKAESAKNSKYDTNIYNLGLGEPVFVSATSGSGVGDLLDIVTQRLAGGKQVKDSKVSLPAEGSPEQAKPIKVALLGRPNVGKSSILNSILGEERVIVSDMPHTTREAHDTAFTYNGRDFIIIDTAGLRKKARVDRSGLEKFSVKKTLDALHECTVAVLVTDVRDGIDMQDKKITQEILESGKSVIIVANKWDTVADKETNTINKFVEYYRKSFPYLWWAPLIFVSAKDNLRTKKILDVVIEAYESRSIKISESQLDKFLKKKIKQHRPSRGKGLKNPYIYEIKQDGINPPRFILMVNDPMVLHFSYIRFLQNNLREQFKIIGTPIHTELRMWKQGIKKPENKKAAHRAAKKTVTQANKKPRIR